MKFNFHFQKLININFFSVDLFIELNDDVKKSKNNLNKTNSCDNCEKCEFKR